MTENPEAKNESDGTVSMSPEMMSPEDISKHMKLFCSKHGDITQAASYLKYRTISPEGKPEETHSFYCLKCLNEIMAEFVAQGKHGKVTIGVPKEILETINKAAAERAGAEASAPSAP